VRKKVKNKILEYRRVFLDLFMYNLIYNDLQTFIENFIRYPKSMIVTSNVKPKCGRLTLLPNLCALRQTGFHLGFKLLLITSVLHIGT